jgi:hypothetical protein
MLIAGNPFSKLLVALLVFSLVFLPIFLIFEYVDLRLTRVTRAHLLRWLITVLPYSPELNPVERFWRYLKQNLLHNRLFETLESLEASLDIFIKSLQNLIVANYTKIII